MFTQQERILIRNATVFPAQILYTKLSEKQCRTLAALPQTEADYDPHNADR